MFDRPPDLERSALRGRHHDGHGDGLGPLARRAGRAGGPTSARRPPSVGAPSRGDDPPRRRCGRVALRPPLPAARRARPGYDRGPGAGSARPAHLGAPPRRPHGGARLSANRAAPEPAPAVSHPALGRRLRLLRARGRHRARRHPPVRARRPDQARQLARLPAPGPALRHPAAAGAQRRRGPHARHARRGGRAARDHARPGRPRGGLAGHRVSGPEGPCRPHHLRRGDELGEAGVGCDAVRAPRRRSPAGRRRVHLRGQGPAAGTATGAVAAGARGRDHAPARSSLREGGARSRRAGLRSGRAGRLPGRGHARRPRGVADRRPGLSALGPRAPLGARRAAPARPAGSRVAPPEPLEAALVGGRRRRVRLASAG